MAKSGIKSSGMSMIGKSRSHARTAVSSVGSSPLGRRQGKNDKNITIVLRDDPRRGKTDWARVDALTDEEIEESVRRDPDAVPLDVDWSEAVLVIPPKKKPISIRVDEDVLNYFKKLGAGYQRRMNAVLRSFVEQKRKAPPRKKKRA
jgi:uncharacterized protein (DUF4415 family)